MNLDLRELCGSALLRGWILPGLLFLFVVIIFLPAFRSPTPLFLGDQPMWTAFSEVFRNEVFPDQGWFWQVITDRENAGLVQGNLYSLNLLFFWSVGFFFTAATTVKVFLVVCVFIASLGVYVLGCRFLHPFTAFSCGLLSVHAVIVMSLVGMAYASASWGLAFLFTSACVGFLEKPSRAGWLAALLLLTLAFYAHPTGFMIAGTALAAILVQGVCRTEWGMVLALGLLPPVALLLGAPQFLALLISVSPELVPEYVLQTGVWENILKLGLFPGRFQIIVQWGILILLPLGAYRLGVRHRRLVLPVLANVALCLVLVSGLPLVLFPGVPLLQKLTQFAPRFQEPLGLLYILISAAGVEWILVWLGKVIFSRISTCQLRQVAVVLACLGLVGSIGISLPMRVWNQRPQIWTLEDFEYRRQLSELWEWIDKTVDPESTRVYFEDIFYFEEKMVTHPLALTSVRTRVRQIGGWSGFQSAFATRYNPSANGRIFWNVPGADLAEQTAKAVLKQLNCRYIVASSPALRSRLQTFAFLRESATFPPFAVFEYLEMEPAWAYFLSSQEMIPTRIISPSTYRLHLSGRENDVVRLAVAYHPNWEARAGDVVLPLKSSQSLMEFVLPSSGTFDVMLRYRVDRLTPLVCMALGMVFSLLVLWRLPRVTQAVTQPAPAAHAR